MRRIELAVRRYGGQYWTETLIHSSPKTFFVSRIDRSRNRQERCVRLSECIPILSRLDGKCTDVLGSVLGNMVRKHIDRYH